MISVQLGSSNYAIHNIYKPPNDTDVGVIFEALDAIFDGQKNYIVAGDFNLDLKLFEHSYPTRGSRALDHIWSNESMQVSIRDSTSDHKMLISKFTEIKV